MQYAPLWSEYANINFKFIDQGKSDIRINFDESNTSWSTIGKFAKNVSESKQTMNFGWFRKGTSDREFKRTILHEFGHALGMIHEHSSPSSGICWNKPKVYAEYMNPPNRWDKRTIDRNLFTRYSVTQTQFSKYDRKSIMHYPISQSLLTCDASVGLNTELSYLDKTFISNAYPKNGNIAGFVAPQWGSGDFNHDGKDDIAALYYSPKGFVVRIFSSTSGGNYKPEKVSALMGSGGKYKLGVGNFNGDSVADIGAFHLSPDYGFLSKTSLNHGNGSFTTLTHQFINKGTGGNYTKLVDDFNGDGSDDIGFIIMEPAYGFLTKIAISHADGTFSELKQQKIAEGTGGLYSIVSGDFNGDGKADIAWMHLSSQYGLLTKIALSMKNSNGKYDGLFTNLIETTTDKGFGGSYKYLSGDFNGDSLDDLALFHNSVKYGVLVKVAYSNGNGTFKKLTHYNVGAGFGGNYSLLASDINGDKNDDIVLAYEDKKYGVLIKTIFSSDNGFSELSNYAYN